MALKKIRIPHRSHGKSRPLLWICCLFALTALWYFRRLIYTSWTLAALPFVWSKGASTFFISPEHDSFDISFANYSREQISAHPYEDLVPPVLHHIALGTNGQNSKQWRPAWDEAVQSCVDWHPDWEVHLWTDETAGKFVEERFPELKDMWDNYPYPIERIDALRYMVLYEYGGVILDMDLKCKRGLGPLRRFSFVAPAAHPTGFSIGFMMASKHNPFVGDIVRNLTIYNKRWLGLPYPSVMFSTGCHFASTIHAFQDNRSDLKILSGPKDQPKMHSLNGHVSTPLFDHLGSSSWHSYDASLIVALGRPRKWRRRIFLLVFIVTTIYCLKRSRLGSSLVSRLQHRRVALNEVDCNV